ncbi:glycosyltransferase family 2 protein [Mucilaginibacter lacusdianchii]|uniref:glycosyltransferase family 2 protein n=1 Tax=Mucilaginibacter lacusdianchii TaxID=2684211 RepID=UPI00131B802C|nr:glycosyltransferase family 2 protein [Mucilaginibacter sp. JXJ CY 39]
METVKPELLQAVILSKDEEPNLQRVLAKLTWLDRVVIVDSFSTDATLAIAASFPNVTLVQRVFDTHAGQWNYGLSLADSKWILSLDSDYVLTDEFIAETRRFIQADDKVAYDTNFKFLVFGKELKGNNTTPRPVLFKKEFCSYYDDGHTQRLRINGDTGVYKSIILHDDRKSLTRWLSNQAKYSQKESDKLLNADPETLGFSSKVRKNKVVAPIFVFFYSLFVKGLIFDGWAGWHYTLQRTMLEMLVAMRLVEEENLKGNSHAK